MPEQEARWSTKTGSVEWARELLTAEPGVPVRVRWLHMRPLRGGGFDCCWEECTLTGTTKKRLRLRDAVGISHRVDPERCQFEVR